MRWTVLVTCVLAMVVAGCRAAPPDRQVGTSQPVWVEPICPPNAGLMLLGDGTPARGSVPADFVTSWVLQCRTEFRDLPGKGTWAVRIDERADTAAVELVEQLRRAPDPQTSGACTLELVTPPYFVLVDAAGQAILPAVPGDKCGRPRAEALDALKALPFRTLSETPLREVRSQTSLDSGCAQSYKDMLMIDADRVAPGPASPLWPNAVSTIRVCVYDQISLSGQDVPTGQFASGRTVTGDAAKALLADLERAGPAAACPAPHTRFAVVTAEGNAASVMAEIDGCRRLLRTDNTLGQLNEGALTG